MRSAWDGCPPWDGAAGAGTSTGMGYGHRAVRCEMEADPGTGVPRLTLIAEVRGASEIDSFRSAEAPRTGVRTTPADRLESVLTELGHLPGP